VPIKADNKVLGTFGAYLKNNRAPAEHEIETIRTLCDRASLVLVASS
jgi:hypothetical protein